MRLFEVLLDNQTFIAPTSGPQFRVTFNVLIDFGGLNTYADISFYNLSQDTANRAFALQTTINLRAGYNNTIDTIFNGKIFNVFKERRGPDTITRVIARGGTSFEKPIINQTFGTNANIVELIRACCTSIGYPVVIDASQFSDVRPYATGYSLSGDPLRKLEQLANTHNFSFVLDNDSIVIVRNDAFRGGSPVEVSEATGMEGIPEISEVGCNVTTRLNPKIRIGGRIDIKSQFRTVNFSNVYYVDVPASAGTGLYRVFKLTHSGDSWGDEWSTRIESKR